MNKRPFIKPLVLVISAVAIAIMLIKPTIPVRLTEFYILGSEPNTQDYPHNVTVGNDVSINVGIVNREGNTANYRIEIRLNKTLLDQIDPLVIRDKSIWENPLHFVLKDEGDDQRVDVLLFKKNDSHPYRQLHFFVNVRAKP